MLRASAACEAAGFPTSSLTCEGFVKQAAVTAVGLGMPNIPVAVVPGHIGTKTPQELHDAILNVTMDDVVNNLTVTPAPIAKAGEPQAREIVVKGGFRAVNQDRKSVV